MKLSADEQKLVDMIRAERDRARGLDAELADEIEAAENRRRYHQRDFHLSNLKLIGLAIYLQADAQDSKKLESLVIDAGTAFNKWFDLNRSIFDAECK